jgi:hypothetical protein
VLLVLAAIAGVAGAWLLPTLPIVIMVPIATAATRVIGRDSNNLSGMFRRGRCPCTSNSRRGL